MRDTKTQLTTPTIILHWLVGLTIISLLVVGIYMTQTEDFSLYPIHKSIGTLIFVVIIIRVYWRILNGWLVPIREYKPVEHRLAKTVQWILIIATVLMPISGFIMSGAGGYGVSVFDFEIVASQFQLDPTTDTYVAIPHNKELGEFMHQIHEATGLTMVVAVLLHISGALKHHFVDKDGTLKRMLSKDIG